MKAEQKWKSGQGKLQKKVKKSVGLGICVFLTLLLVSQLHYEKRICLKSGKRKMVTAYS